MNRYILIAGCAITMSACTKEIKVNIPEQQPALVVSSNTVVNDTIRVIVGKSTSILNYKYNIDLTVANASVVLYEDGKALNAMTYDNVSGMYNSKAVAVPGREYSIKVSAAGYTDAEATSEVESAVTINSIKRLKNVRVDMDGRNQDELVISFDDPAAQGDFYIISILPPPYYNDTFSTQHLGCVNTTDASVESIYNESIDQNTCLSAEAIFLRDALFNGKTKEFRVYVPSESLLPVQGFNGDTAYASVSLYHVPEAYFRYRKSYQFASENMGNPFAEPTNVYSNVKNGYGIFSVISVDSKELK